LDIAAEYLAALKATPIDTERLKFGVLGVIPKSFGSNDGDPRSFSDN
jgi:hypothetical protein